MPLNSNYLLLVLDGWEEKFNCSFYDEGLTERVLISTITEHEAEKQVA